MSALTGPELIIAASLPLCRFFRSSCSRPAPYRNLTMPSRNTEESTPVTFRDWKQQLGEPQHQDVPLGPPTPSPSPPAIQESGLSANASPSPPLEPQPVTAPVPRPILVVPFHDEEGNFRTMPRPYALSVGRLHWSAVLALSRLSLGQAFFLTLRSRNRSGHPGWTVPRPQLSVPADHTHVAVRSQFASIFGWLVVQYHCFPLQEYMKMCGFFEVIQRALASLPCGDWLTFGLYGLFRTHEGPAVFTTFKVETFEVAEDLQHAAMGKEGLDWEPTFEDELDRTASEDEAMA